MKPRMYRKLFFFFHYSGELIIVDRCSIGIFQNLFNISQKVECRLFFWQIYTADFYPASVCILATNEFISFYFISWKSLEIMKKRAIKWHLVWFCKWIYYYDTRARGKEGRLGKADYAQSFAISVVAVFLKRVLRRHST